MSVRAAHIQRTNYFAGGDKNREDFLAEPACTACGDCDGAKECSGCDSNWTPCKCNACKSKWTDWANGMGGVTKNAALYTKKVAWNNNTCEANIAAAAKSMASHNKTQVINQSTGGG
jgi:hypothetical protein